MEFLPLSFIAGILTILAPCVLPVLPVVLGSSFENAKDKLRPIVITVSLAVSIVVFTLLLKASTLLINIDPRFWNILSGGIIFFFGIVTLFPDIWERIEIKLKLNTVSGGLLQSSSKQKGILGQVLVGASLGPVFASCSPTYAIIVAVILPTSFLVGIVNLIVYAIGLAIILILVAILGQRFLAKVKWAVNPRGTFKKLLGVFFILLGIAISTGFIKKIEAALLDAGFADVTKIETRILERMDEEKTEDDSSILNIKEPYQAPDLKDINSWINSEELSLNDLRGKVVLIDFWTYSCINCIRTLPFLRDWHDKYAEEGLVIIGVHAPEFAFEKIRSNVERAVSDYEITYPVAMDNDFSTWRAYENQYWPAKYFIDKDGKVRHTHFGEGAYEENEQVIRTLLNEAGSNIEDIKINTEPYRVPISQGQSPETYINYLRGAGLVPQNLQQFKADRSVNYQLQQSLLNNQWSLGGKWIIQQEHSISGQNGSSLKYKFSAKEVFLVMGANKEAKVMVLVNGKPITATNKGEDVNKNGVVTVSKYDLYRLVNLSEFKHGVELELIFDAGVQVNAFTFGS